MLKALAVFTFSLKFFHAWDAGPDDTLYLGGGIFGISDSTLNFVSDSFLRNALEGIVSGS